MSRQAREPSTTTQSPGHGWNEETPEAKARWFQSLPLSQRMDLLCWFTDLILENNPRIVERRDAQPTSERVRVVTRS